MKKFMKGTLSILLVAILMIGTVSSAIAATIDKATTGTTLTIDGNDSYDNFENDCGVLNFNTEYHSVYQTITMPSTDSINSITVQMKNYSSSYNSATFSAALYTVTTKQASYSTVDVPEENLIAESTNTVTVTGTSYSNYTFNFPNYSNSSGVKRYAFVIKAESSSYMTMVKRVSGNTTAEHYGHATTVGEFEWESLYYVGYLDRFYMQIVYGEGVKIEDTNDMNITYGGYQTLAVGKMSTLNKVTVRVRAVYTDKGSATTNTFKIGVYSVNNTTNAPAGTALAEIQSLTSVTSVKMGSTTNYTYTTITVDFTDENITLNAGNRYAIKVTPVNAVDANTLCYWYRPTTADSMTTSTYAGQSYGYMAASTSTSYTTGTVSTSAKTNHSVYLSHTVTEYVEKDLEGATPKTYEETTQVTSMSTASGSYYNTTGANYGIYSNTYKMRYQTFTMPYTATPSSVTVNVSRYSASYAPRIYAYIYAVNSSNKPTGNALCSTASTNNYISPSSTTYQDVTVSFLSASQLTKDTRYALVLYVNSSTASYGVYWNRNKATVSGFDGEYYGFGTAQTTVTGNATACAGMPYVFTLNHNSVEATVTKTNPVPSTELQVNMKYYDNDVNGGTSAEAITYTKNYTQKYTEETKIVGSQVWVPGTPATSGTSTVDYSGTTGTDGTASWGYSEFSNYAYQTFTANKTGTVKSVTVNVSGGTALTAELYTVSGGVPSSRIATASSTKTATLSYSNLTFTFSSGSVTEGTQYAIVLSMTSYAKSAWSRTSTSRSETYGHGSASDMDYYGQSTGSLYLQVDIGYTIPGTDGYWDNSGTTTELYYVPTTGTDGLKRVPEYITSIAAELDSTKLHSSIYDDYTFKTSQAEYEAMMQTTVNPHSLYEGGTKDYNNMYYYGTYYDGSKKTDADGYKYHTDEYGEPQYGSAVTTKDNSGNTVQTYPAGDNQKWITYYTKNSSGGYDEITEAKALEEWLKVDKIDIWLFNVPKSYEVKIYNDNFTTSDNVTYVAGTATKTVNATYNQRLGGRNTPYLPVPKASSSLTSALATLDIENISDVIARLKTMYNTTNETTLLGYMKKGVLLDPRLFYEVNSSVTDITQVLVTSVQQENICKAYDMTWTGSAEQKELLLKIYKAGRLINAALYNYDVTGTLPSNLTYPAPKTAVSSVDEYFRKRLGMEQFTKDFVQGLYDVNGIQGEIAQDFDNQQEALLKKLTSNTLAMPQSEVPDNHGDMRNAYLAAYNTLAYTGTTATAAENIKSGKNDLIFAYWSGDAQGKTILSTENNYNFRITDNMSIYAVYKDVDLGEMLGVTMTKANTQVYFENNVSHTRMNTIINPYGFYDNDSSITHTAAIYVVGNSSTSLDNADAFNVAWNEVFLNLMMNCVNDNLGSTSFSQGNSSNYNYKFNDTTEATKYIKVANYYIYLEPNLTNKNRMSFGLDFTTTNLKGRTLYAFGAVRHNKYGEPMWSLSDNCIKYAFDSNGAISESKSIGGVW